MQFYLLVFTFFLVPLQPCFTALQMTSEHTRVKEAPPPQLGWIEENEQNRKSFSLLGIDFKKIYNELDMMVIGCNSRLGRQIQEDHCEFENMLV